MGSIGNDAKRIREDQEKQRKEKQREEWRKTQEKKARILEGRHNDAAEYAEEVLGSLRDRVTKAAREGHSSVVIYKLDGDLSPGWKNMRFGAGLAPECLPDYALKLYKHCKAEGLDPTIDYQAPPGRSPAYSGGGGGWSGLRIWVSF